MSPRIRALNGIWQDDLRGDAYDIRAFAHFGGAAENDLETYYFPEKVNLMKTSRLILPSARQTMSV